MATAARFVSNPKRGPERRSRFVAPLTAGASLATALALLALAATMFGPVAALGQTGDGGAGANLVRQFYAAANDVLAGGDPAALAAVVAPDLVVHGPSGQTGKPEALGQQLAALRASAPDARLVVGDVFVAGDRAAARVTLDGTLDAPGVPLAGPPALASGTEFFRLAGGRIAEYWPLDDADRLVRALPPAPIGFWQGARHANLARFDFPAGATIDNLQGPWPHFLIGVAGNLTVSLHGGASFAAADQTPAVWRPTAPGGQTIVLRPGDALAIPPDVTHSLRNGGDAPATTFGVLVYDIGDLLGSEHYSMPAVSDLLSIYSAGFIGKRIQRDGNAVTELIGSESDVTISSTARTLSIAWLPLAADQTIPVHRIDGIEALLPLSGMLLVDRSPQGPVPMPSDNPRPSALGGSPAVAYRSATPTVGSVPPWVVMERVATQGNPPGPAPIVLMAGEAATFSSGWSANTRAIGAGVASVLLIRIADMTTASAAEASPPAS